MRGVFFCWWHVSSHRIFIFLFFFFFYFFILFYSFYFFILFFHFFYFSIFYFFYFFIFLFFYFLNLDFTFFFFFYFFLFHFFLFCFVFIIFLICCFFKMTQLGHHTHPPWRWYCNLSCCVWHCQPVLGAPLLEKMKLDTQIGMITENTNAIVFVLHLNFTQNIKQ